MSGGARNDRTEARSEGPGTQNGDTPQDPATVERMWRAFMAGTGAGDSVVLCGTFAFGDSPEMADELAGLVLHGPKRATAGLYVDYAAGGEKVPAPGNHWAVLDGRREPVCVIRTTQVEIKPLDQVDGAFAWDEGEGDRSLAFWLEAHQRFFRRSCERSGEQFTDDIMTVCERFDLVWPVPPALA